MTYSGVPVSLAASLITAWTLMSAHAAAESTLLDAAQMRDVQTVRRLIGRRVDVNATAPDGATALHWAAHWDDMEMASLLLAAGANVKAANQFGVTALSLACENASVRMVDALLKAGADPDAALRNGETPLMTAARTGNAAVARALIARGADLRAREVDRGQTALAWAVAERHPDVVQVLVDAGADVTARSNGGFTPLMFAAREGDLDSARVLVGAGAPVDDMAQESCPECTALIVATVRGHVALAEFLLDHGANPNADGTGYTALHWTAGSWETEVTGVNGITSTDEELSHLAGFRGQERLELVKALLAHGANVNARLRRSPPRQGGFSAFGNHRVTVSLVGATPMALAALAGDAAVMRVLAAGGADPSLTTDDRSTPLMLAAGLGHVQAESLVTEPSALEAVNVALELGGDINAVNTRGQTALHGAAHIRANSVVERLIQRGAKMDVQDRRGETPLIIAESNFQYSGTPVKVRTSTGDLLRKLGAQ